MRTRKRETGENTKVRPGDSRPRHETAKQCTVFLRVFARFALSGSAQKRWARWVSSRCRSPGGAAVGSQGREPLVREQIIYEPRRGGRPFALRLLPRRSHCLPSL